MNYYVGFIECLNCYIWREIAERFNFTIEYRDLNASAGVEVNAMLEALHNNEAESGTIAFIYSAERALTNRFVWPIFLSRVGLTTAAADAELDLSSFTKPFSQKFWFALLSWLTLVGAILAAFVYAVDRLIYRMDSTPSGLFGTFYIPFQAICSQGHTLESPWIGIRTVLFICYILPVFVLNAYSGGITSSLANPNRKPFTNLKGFEKNRKYKLQAIDNSYFAIMLMGHPLFMPMRKNNLVVKTMPENAKEAVIKLCADKVTFLSEVPLSSPHPVKCSVYVLDDNIGSYFGGMAVANNCPFVEHMRRYIQKRIIHGVNGKDLEKKRLKKFKFELDVGKYKLQSTELKSLKPTAVENILLLFAILLCGTGLSVAILLLEMWRKKEKIIPRYRHYRRRFKQF